jgi:hypothetical protein
MGPDQLLVNADDANMLWDKINATNRNSYSYSKVASGEVNTEKTKYLFMSCTRELDSLKTENRCLEKMVTLKYLQRAPTNLNLIFQCIQS